MGVLGTALVALGLLTSSIVQAVNKDAPNLNPTVDISAVRYIYCDNPNGKDGWTGSGSIVGKNLVLTALHVANGANCMDLMTKKPLRLIASDPAHDLAFMAGELPDIPPIKMSCAPYVKGQTYIGFGISDYMRDGPLLRLNILVANGRQNVTLEDKTVDKNIQDMKGAIVPGQSGGPIVDVEGEVHGVINIGDQDDLGYPLKSSGSYELAVSSFCKK